MEAISKENSDNFMEKVYEDAVETLIHVYGGFSNLYARDDNKWETLPIPPQKSLDKYAIEVLKLLSLCKYVLNAGYGFKVRPPKTVARVEAKKSKPPKIMPAFKRSSDFAGVRIEIPDVRIIYAIQNLFIADLISIDPDVKIYTEINVFNSNEIDIVHRLYFYSKVIANTVVEVWFGHPFAFNVFAQNSYMREHPEEADQYIDWFENDAYNTVKAKILDVWKHDSKYDPQAYRKTALAFIGDKKHMINCWEEYDNKN